MIGVLATIVIGLAAAVPSTSEPKPIPEGYVPVIDATGALVVAVPATWTDVDPQPAVRDGVAQPYIAASPDLTSFLTSFDVPGAMYSAFPFTADPLVLLESHGLRAGCATFEVKTYDDPIFVGAVQVGTDCGPNHLTWNMVVASPADRSFTAVVQVQAPAGDEAIEIVRRTFNVVPGAVPTFSSVPDPVASTTTAAAPTTSTVPP